MVSNTVLHSVNKHNVVKHSITITQCQQIDTVSPTQCHEPQVTVSYTHRNSVEKQQVTVSGTVSHSVTNHRLWYQTQFHKHSVANHWLRYQTVIHQHSVTNHRLWYQTLIHQHSMTNHRLRYQTPFIPHSITNHRLRYQTVFHHHSIRSIRHSFTIKVSRTTGYGIKCHQPQGTVSDTVSPTQCHQRQCHQTQCMQSTYCHQPRCHPLKHVTSNKMTLHFKQPECLKARKPSVVAADLYTISTLVHGCGFLWLQGWTFPLTTVKGGTQHNSLTKLTPTHDLLASTQSLNHTVHKLTS